MTESPAGYEDHQRFLHPAGRLTLTRALRVDPEEEKRWISSSGLDEAFKTSLELSSFIDVSAAMTHSPVQISGSTAEDSRPPAEAVAA